MAKEIKAMARLSNTPESNKKRSLSLIGHPMSEETKRKISESLKGKKLSDDHKKKLSESHLGYIMPQEQKNNIKKAHDKNVINGKCHLYKDGRCLIPGYLSWINNKRNRVINRIKSELGSHTYNDWECLKEKYNYTCPCCHKTEPDIKLTEDHIIPLSSGGSDLIENIQPLCQSCNSKKQTKTIKYEIQ